MPSQRSLRSWTAAALIAGALALFPVIALAQTTTVGVGGNEDLGSFLVASNQMTLYTFSSDDPGVSNCTGGCATAWPPLTVADGETASAGAGVSGTLVVITRDDGSQQVTIDGSPLYFFASDADAGDANGHGAGGGTWAVVKVTAAAQLAPASTGNAGLSASGAGTSAALGALLVAPRSR